MAEIRQGVTDRARTIVIVPHNGLLAQHVAGARETVLRSTAPAPLGVRKVHKNVYNISSIFNLGLALRALAAVPLLYYTPGWVGVMLGLGWGYVRFVVGVMLGLWLGLC